MPSSIFIQLFFLSAVLQNPNHVIVMSKRVDGFDLTLNLTTRFMPHIVPPCQCLPLYNNVPPRNLLYKIFSTLSKLMSNTKMIALPPDANNYKKLLFELEGPVELNQEQYDAYWPLVDSVWTKIGGATIQQNGTIEVQHYECRLRKSKKTGTKTQNEGRVVKNRITFARVKDLCQVRMKITRTLERPILVRIERKDNNKHTHDIEESFRLCGLPTAVRRVIQTEASKDYTAAQIFHALKGAGKSEGSSDLEIAGGSSLKRYINKPCFIFLLIYQIDKILSMRNVGIVQITAHCYKVYPSELMSMKHVPYYLQKDGYLPNLMYWM